MKWWKAKTRNPVDDPTALVNLLVSLGWVTRDEADFALATHKTEHAKLRIGEVLVKTSGLSKGQLAEALFKQRAMRGQLDPEAVAEHAQLIYEAAQAQGQDALRELAQAAEGLRYGLSHKR